MYCQNCGALLQENSKYCHSCGSLIIIISNDIPPRPQKENIIESNNDNKKTEEIYTNTNQKKWILSELSFFNLLQFIKDPEFINEESIDSTGPCEVGELLVPSIYFLNNKDFSFDNEMVIKGLMLTVFSFTNKIAFCLETYTNPFIKYYDAEKNKFTPFLIIDRKNLKSFSQVDHQKYKALKPKNSNKFFRKATEISVLGNRSGFIGGLILQLATRGVTKLIDKVEDDIIEKVGTIFHLNFLDNGKEVSVDIVCETFYADTFELFLKKQWTVNTPKREKDPETTEEKNQYAASMLKVGDTVRVPRFFNYEYGIIIKKEKEHAVVKIITKDGLDKFENIEYLKLRKIRENIINDEFSVKSTSTENVPKENLTTQEFRYNSQEKQNETIEPDIMISAMSQGPPTYEDKIIELQKLKNHGLFTTEEYEKKVMKLKEEHEKKVNELKIIEEQKEKEKKEILYKQRLNDKIRPFMELLKDAKNKQLLSEDEYIKKEKEIVEKCKMEIEYEDSYRPQFSDISKEISDRAKAYISRREAFIRQLIKKIEVGDVLVYGYGYVKKFDRNQWQTLKERDKVKDYEIIIMFDEEEIKKSIIKKPRNAAIVFYNNGNDNLDNNNLFEAIQDYDKAIEIDSSFAEAYYNRGVAKHNQNDFHGALTDYNKAIEINPNYGPAYFGRGLIKLILLDEKGGRQDIVKASELDCPEAKEKINAIDSAKRKKDEFTLPDYP